MIQIEFLPEPEWFVFSSDESLDYQLNPETGEYVNFLTQQALDKEIVHQIKESFKRYLIGDFVYHMEDDQSIYRQINRRTTHGELYEPVKCMIKETFQPDLGPIEFASRLLKISRKYIEAHGRYFCVVPRAKDDHIELVVSGDEIYVSEVFTICRLSQL